MTEKQSTQEARMEVRGMTCTDCEIHVKSALEKAGAQDVSVDWRRGEARFKVSDGADLDELGKAVAATGYKPGEAELFSLGERPAIDEEVDYDLAIIGSGGAAFSAAIQATNRDAKVVMIERGTMGGTCVNIGCVPSKTLLRAGDINQLAAHHPFAGLLTSAGKVDLAALIQQKDELVEKMREEKYEDLVDEYGFEVIRGEATFEDEKTVSVAGRKIKAAAYLIATGAAPAVPDISGLKETSFLTSTTALELQEVPKRMAIIGAGYIALELGQLFQHLGADVTLMQRSERILKEYDPEISEAVTRFLEEDGIRFIPGVNYEQVEHDGSVFRIHIEVDGRKKVVEAEQLLVATGRTPNTKALNLERAGVKTGRRGEVVVDEYMRTSNPRIYAAGDVTMGPQFVYVAALGGAVAADNAIGAANRKADLRVVPGVIFTNPSIATVGLTEEEAREKGYEVKTSVLPLDAVPRALVNRETTGVFKLVADRESDRLLGAHIVAENAGDVIYAATLAVKIGLTVQEIKETLAPYLTMAEGLKLAALTFDSDVSKLSCCAG